MTEIQKAPMTRDTRFANSARSGWTWTHGRAPRRRPSPARTEPRIRSSARRSHADLGWDDADGEPADVQARSTGRANLRVRWRPCCRCKRASSKGLTLAANGTLAFMVAIETANVW